MKNMSHAGCILVHTIISPCCVLQSRQQFYKEDLSHYTLLIISNFLKVIIFPSTPDTAHCSCFSLKTARNNNNSLFPCERYFFCVYYSCKQSTSRAVIITSYEKVLKVLQISTGMSSSSARRTQHNFLNYTNLNFLCIKTQSGN